MRATALEPPPPTPKTRIRVRGAISSWITNFSASSAMDSLLQSADHQSHESPGSPLRRPVQLQLRRIHRQAGRGGPDRAVQLLRPIFDPLGQTQTGGAV